MITSITTQNFFNGRSFVGPTRISFERGAITRIEPHEGVCEYPVVSPGLCDVQMNGFAAFDVSYASLDEMVELDRVLFAEGTTQWLATVITAPLDRLAERIRELDKIFISGVCPGMRGIHIEGPFLGSAPGAHRTDWIKPIDIDWLEALPTSVRLVTIAPEQSLAADATQLLAAKGVTVSMGHSVPTSEQITTMMRAGASMVTHLFNGMSGVHHRDDGLALRALVEPSVTAGLIADMIHVSPEAVALAFAAKGGQGVCLVSDTVAWETERAYRREISLTDGAPRLPNGTIAGSATPLAACVRKCVHDAGINPMAALMAATSTPRSLLDGVVGTEIGVASPVDLVAFDDDFHVVGVWRGLVSQCA